MKQKHKQPIKQRKLDLSQKVMAKIKEDNIQVQPKWQFLMGSFLLSFGMLSATVLSIYLISVSWYRLRAHSSMQYLMFGSDGHEAFLATFPWIFLLLSIISLYMGVRIIKKFDVSYKIKWQFWLAGLILGVVVAGVWIDMMGVNRALENQVMTEPLYVKYNQSQDWYKGEISQVQSRRMTVTTMDSGHVVQVKWSEQTKLPLGSEFKQGHWVIMVGDWRGEYFEADGIEKVNRPY